MKLTILNIICVLVIGTTCGQDCLLPLPSVKTINDELVRQYKNTLGEGSHDTVVTTLSNYSYICQAVGSKDMYRSVSLAVKFKASDKSYDQYQKLQMQGYCDGMIKVWDSLNFNTNFDDAIFSIPLHINCKSCLDDDNEANCSRKFSQ